MTNSRTATSSKNTTSTMSTQAKQISYSAPPRHRTPPHPSAPHTQAPLRTQASLRASSSHPSSHPRCHAGLQPEPWKLHSCCHHSASGRVGGWRGGGVGGLGRRQCCGRRSTSMHARQMYECQPCCNMFAHITDTLTNTQVGPCKTVSGDTYVMGGAGASSNKTWPQPWVPNVVLDLRGRILSRIVRDKSRPRIFRTRKRPHPLGPVLMFSLSPWTHVPNVDWHVVCAASGVFAK
jgi:hypothetical protein